MSKLKGALALAAAVAMVLAVSMTRPRGAEIIVPALPALYRDGCSGGLSWFYKRVLKRTPAWEVCCDAHDRLYGPGGTADARVRADRGLYLCMKRAGHPYLAAGMLVAVRVGGQPFFPVDWRWGFNRSYAESYWYDQYGGSNGW